MRSKRMRCAYKGKNLSRLLLDSMGQLVIVQTYMAQIDLKLILFQQ